jgi:hypothetical protein
MAILSDYAAIPLNPSDYVIDVFVSYKRDPQGERWMNEVVKIIDRELSMALGGSCVMFFDRASIPAGANWQTILRKAIQSSRCALAFWSPAYFTASEWCVTEWQSFKQREEALKLQDGWITYPVRRDIGPFPPEFGKIQCPDLSSYCSTMPAFWKTKRAVLLEDELRRLINDLANRISQAPPFQPTFPFTPSKPFPRPAYQPRFAGTAVAA